MRKISLYDAMASFADVAASLGTFSFEAVQTMVRDKNGVENGEWLVVATSTGAVIVRFFLEISRCTERCRWDAKNLP